MINVQSIIRDFQGLPISGYTFMAVFVGSAGEESSTTISETSMTGGIVTLRRVWVKPEGSLRLMGVPIAGQRAPGMLLEGNATYRLSGRRMTFEVNQGAQRGTITAGSRQEAEERLSAEGSVGITLGPVEVGGGVSTESGRTRERSRQQQWEVLRARPNLTITQQR